MSKKIEFLLCVYTRRPLSCVKNPPKTLFYFLLLLDVNNGANSIYLPLLPLSLIPVGLWPPQKIE